MLSSMQICICSKHIWAREQQILTLFCVNRKGSAKLAVGRSNFIFKINNWCILSAFQVLMLRGWNPSCCRLLLCETLVTSQFLWDAQGPDRHRSHFFFWPTMLSLRLSSATRLRLPPVPFGYPGKHPAGPGHVWSWAFTSRVFRSTTLHYPFWTRNVCYLWWKSLLFWYD